MIDYITANWADIGALALQLLGIFSLVAKLTPTDVDDKLLQKVLSVIHFLGLTKK